MFWACCFAFLTFTVFVGAIVIGVTTDPNRGKIRPHVTQVKEYGQDCIAVPSGEEGLKAGMYCKERIG